MNRKRVGILFIIALLLTACSASAGRLLVQGNRAFQDGDYDAALHAYRAAQARAPAAAAPLYNLANTFYRQEIYTQTQQLLPQAISQAGGDLLQHSYYNLGNAHFQRQDWGVAIDAYKEALRLNPDDQAAKYNLELALHQQPQEQPPESQQDDAQTEENDQDPDEQEQQDGGAQNQQNEDEQDQSAGEQPGAEPSDQQNNEEQSGDQEQSGDESAEEQNQSAPQSPAQAQPAEAPPEGLSEGLSEEQARQLLQIVGENAGTLQEQMQQQFIGSGPLPEKDW